jgi:hypothetical protein
MSNFDLNPIGAIADSVMSGLDALFTSDEERAEAKLKLTTELQKPHILQALTNIEEAKHRSIFVAGWRPALGWICAIGVGYHFLVAPSLNTYLTINYPGVDLPVVDADTLFNLVLALLGLGGLRTYEKGKGLTK